MQLFNQGYSGVRRKFYYMETRSPRVLSLVKKSKYGTYEFEIRILTLSTVNPNVSRSRRSTRSGKLSTFESIGLDDLKYVLRRFLHTGISRF